MTQLTNEQRRLLGALSDLAYCNPFEPFRIELERTVLGSAYREEPLEAWSRTEATGRSERPNVVAVNQRAEQLVERLCEGQRTSGPLNGRDAVLYDDLVTYTLYYRYLALLPPPLVTPVVGDREIAKIWRAFRDDREQRLRPLAAKTRATLASSDHLFACLHQVRRAFNGVFNCLIGESRPATRLRAAVWQSIFTHDLRRYRRTLYRRMGELSTLVTGPSGTGKELIAQAIGNAQYRAFDGGAASFQGDDEAFIALNLSALSPTLIESELFGHRKGAFTGATSDRAGWLERCPSHGAVLLDEIGELEPSLQVKLLRVAQSRDYSRLGESTSRRFAGKLIAATNRDLTSETRTGRFREDLYYRLCSDQLVAPSLREQLDDRPEAIQGLVHFLAGRVIGDADQGEVEQLAGEATAWIAKRLPAGYAWPGNIRELEQCVRGVLVRREYQPSATEAENRPDWLTRAADGAMTADELLDAYCRLVYRRQGGYEPAARVLGLDRRTVKSRVARGEKADLEPKGRA